MKRRQMIGSLLASSSSLYWSPSVFGQSEAAKSNQRPQPPYRVWFQPRCFHRDISLYRSMTMDASGWLDPYLCDSLGISGLRWVYGTQNPYAEGPEYWVTECSGETLTLRRHGEDFRQPGVAIDEWIPPDNPQIEKWIASGLRTARKRNPEIFIAVWVTDLRPALTSLLKDGTVDLAIIEGYTHTPARFGPHAWLAWPTCLRRCEMAKEAEVLEKTIFCFGHVTDEPNINGESLKRSWLDEKVPEIKERYPEMPGIAFYQSDSPDTPELRRLVRHCDRLSGKYWPDTVAR